ncbi:nucleoside-diphosphate-sugar epimerase [Stella humosa]|uniref:Nucleoside-diphosphate-sugar epimerase n=1 Tax=Stella humosa TaxID=94 RepID=A0A3N1LJP8_9PROT|nr:SDR family oxidoreductase [Stella humosa]ROP90646.1 nucleoside-diphosphate-sugar epimerase [Stella humosa]BBK29456.1 NAD(P)-dependent oxidoreductase [Stella humosa]
MDPSSPRLFCFGLGYVGLAVARDRLAAGWRVAGTARDPGRLARAAAAGIEVHRFAGDAPLDPAVLAGTTHLISTAAPDGARDPVLAALAPAIRALPGLQWVGYLSSTGVYGDRGGGWVDEDVAPQPSGPRGRHRLQAEEAWRDLWRHHGSPVHVFRLAGIYGPGRSAIDQMRAGAARRIVKPGQFFSRIHRDDIVAVLRASMAAPRPGSVYNLADDLPAAPDEVVAYAAGLLGVDPPPAEPYAEAEATMSPMARSFYADNRRISNRRIRQDLGVALAYPTYREGLSAIAATLPAPGPSGG